MTDVITKDKLKDKLEKEDDINLVEVLSPEDYEKEHIKGAINMPVRTVGREARKQFDMDEEIIVYCASPSCSASLTAAQKLEDMGFTHVYDFHGGKTVWKEAGFPMETGT